RFSPVRRPAMRSSARLRVPVSREIGGFFSLCTVFCVMRILAVASRGPCRGVGPDWGKTFAGLTASKETSRALVCWHIRGRSRCKVDSKLKNMMKELGEAINQSISDSDDIAEVISRIKAGGYDVFLVLEATIGFNQREPEEEPAPVNRKSPPDFELTGQDAKF